MEEAKTQVTMELTAEELKGLERVKKRIAKSKQEFITKDKYPKSGYIKDPDYQHLYVSGIRILTPKNYEAIRNCIKQDQHKTIFDVLLVTGMRYIEMLRLYEHREWYNERRNIIHLSEEAQRKHKRRQLERTIHPLPSMFNYILKDFFNGKQPPLEATWNKNIQRWAIEAGLQPYGVSAKTTRKTIESWSIAAGILESTVCLRQGHDNLTSMRHYQGLAFNESEVNDIKKQLIAWGFQVNQQR
jgi:integrase